MQKVVNAHETDNTALKTSSPVSQDDKVERLLDAFLSGRNPRTMKAYGQDIAGFAEHLGVATIEAAARTLFSMVPGDANAAVLGYRTQLVDRELAPATINRRLASLRSLVKLGRTLGVVPWTLEIQNVKGQAYRDTRGPGRPAIRMMLGACRDRHDDKGIRDYAILRLLFDLGLRRGEVVSLRLEDVELEASTLEVLGGKGQAQRVSLTLPGATKDALGEWILRRGDEGGPLFSSFDRARKGGPGMSSEAVYRMVRRVGESVGVKTRPHGIRHTAITEAVKAAQANGYGLEEVTDFSRHRSVSTLMIYRDRERNVQGKLAEMVAAGM